MAAIDQFSGFEVIRAAMEVEKSGRAFYTTMAESAESEVARDIFRRLAHDEIEHLNTLQRMEEKYVDGDFWQNEAEFVPYLQRFREKEIFPSRDRLEEVLKMDNVDIRVIDLAIEAEESFAAFFRKAEAHAVTADGKDAFGWLAEEEEKHARVLKERRARITG